jgi:uncharacterized RDD family membrane protein YckC
MEETVSISTPDHVTLEFELAGLGSRFSAYLIDTVLIFAMIVVLIVVMFLSGIAGSRVARTMLKGGSAWIASSNLALLILFGFLIYWGYYVFFEGLKQGSTPGKKRLGIRVIRQDGLPIGFREAALRNLVRAADMLPPPCYMLGGLVMYFDPQGRRLGDMVAGTLVVVEKFASASNTAAGAAWAVRVAQGSPRQAVTLPRGTISADQIGLIEQFIARRYSLPKERRDLLVWQIAEPLLPLVGEDRDAVNRDPQRASYCERLLLEILEMAQAKAAPRQSRNSEPPRPSSLF